jgi:hypothetical protein
MALCIAQPRNWESKLFRVASFVFRVNARHRTRDTIGYRLRHEENFSLFEKEGSREI